MQNDRIVFCKSGLTIVTEDADGEVYTIIARHPQDIIKDWHGECNFVPANDAQVFLSVLDGTIFSLPEECDFGSFMSLLIESTAQNEGEEHAVQI